MCETGPGSVTTAVVIEVIMPAVAYRGVPS